jgi:hypothetical protein
MFLISTEMRVCGCEVRKAAIDAGRISERCQHGRHDAQMGALERADVARNVDDLINGGQRLCGLVIERSSLLRWQEAPFSPNK